MVGFTVKCSRVSDGFVTFAAHGGSWRGFELVAWIVECGLLGMLLRKRVRLSSVSEFRWGDARPLASWMLNFCGVVSLRRRGEREWCGACLVWLSANAFRCGSAPMNFQ